MIIGEEGAVSELWEAARRKLPAPREDRPGPAGLHDLGRRRSRARPACARRTLDDLDLLVPACAAAHEVELGIDPLARDADGFRWRTRTQIEEGRSWLWVEDGVILFKAEASAWTPAAVQLQQVWVDPAARGAGNGEPRPARPDPAAARAGAARLPLRPRRQPARDQALRLRSACSTCSTTGASLPVRELVLARHGESEFSVARAAQRRPRRRGRADRRQGVEQARELGRQRPEPVDLVRAHRVLATRETADAALWPRRPAARAARS